jgi:hypothetical protein
MQMQVLIDTDHSVEGSKQFSHDVETEVRAVLHRYADQITRLEVHLSDESGGKSDGADKRCLIEARPVGHEPMTSSHDAATLEGAVEGAAKKMAHSLGSTLGRLNNHKGQASIRTENAID